MSILIPTTITVTLDNDQIKALPTTAVEIVAAPGAGKRVVLLFGHSTWDFRGGFYENIGSTTARFLYGTSTGRAASSYIVGDDVSSMLADGSDVYTADVLPPSIIVTGVEYSPISYVVLEQLENQPIIFYISNTLGNFTGGHADNTLKVTVLYVVIDV